MNSADEFLEVFLAETREELNKATNFILGLSTENSADLMRILHTIKGNARMMELSEVSDTAHLLEDCVQGFSKGGLNKEQVEDFLLNGMDALNKALGELEAKKPVKIPLNSMAKQFEKLVKCIPKVTSQKESAKRNSIPKQSFQKETPPNDSPFIDPMPDLKSISVSAKSMDVMMNLVGQLNTKLSALKELGEEFDEAVFRRSIRDTEQLINRLNSALLSERMYPLEKIFERYPRMVRELAKEQGKDINFVIKCSDVKLDRSVIDVLNDPIVHILRNAIDHGIETNRKERGKVSQATIELKAEKLRESVLITISDDGAGINTNLVVQKAIEKGLIPKGAILKPDDVYNILLHSGLSTKDKPTKISGRGIGMDIVYRNVKQVGGNVTLKSVFGKGTEVQLRLPLTMAIINSVLVKAGGFLFAIPLLRVSQIKDFVPGENFVSLGSLIGSPGPNNKIIVYDYENRQIGIGVEDVLSRHNLLVNKPIQRVASIPGIGGTTILPNGEVCLVLEMDPLLRGEDNVQIN
jgi:two-component system chemotaxis sensor kinase CheA